MKEATEELPTNHNQQTDGANHPIKQWFKRAEEALNRLPYDEKVLAELGAELRKMLFEATLAKDVDCIWSMYLHFMELSRQQRNTGIQLNWFREQSAHHWISAMSRQIDKAFEPGGVEDELELLHQMIATMPANEAGVVAESMQRMIQENPAFIEREDPDALTMFANEIRGRLLGAIHSQKYTLVVAIFYKIEHDRHWWRAIWHDPIFNAWWQREVNYQHTGKEQK